MLKRLLVLSAFLFVAWPSHSSAGVSTLKMGAFDGSISYDAECGVERLDCKVIFTSDSLEISDGTKIPYLSIIDLQGGDLAHGVECAKELPIIPYVKQGKGFPCWAGTSSYYILIAHRSDQVPELSVFSFKNNRTYKEFLMNAFAARFAGGVPAK
jgi:hypothetical protein